MSTPILRLIVGLHLGLAGLVDRAQRDDRGQSTAEYALVLAFIAILVAAVFTKKDAFAGFFTAAIKKVTEAMP